MISDSVKQRYARNLAARTAFNEDEIIPALDNLEKYNIDYRELSYADLARKLPLFISAFTVAEKIEADAASTAGAPSND